MSIFVTKRIYMNICSLILPRKTRLNITVAKVNLQYFSELNLCNINY